MVEMVALFALDSILEEPKTKGDDDDGSLRLQCCQKDNIELLHVLQAHHFWHLSMSTSTIRFESVIVPHIKGDQERRNEALAQY